MLLIISTLAASIILVNVVAYLVFRWTIKKYDPLPINNETREKIENINLWRNRIIKYYQGPQLLLLSLLMVSLLFHFTSNDLERFQIIQNPRLVLAQISKTYTKKFDDKIYYHIDYEFSLKTKNGNTDTYVGSGKINKKDFYDIGENSLLKVTYNHSNPEKSQIGDFTNLTLKRMIMNCIIPYTSLISIYALALFGSYFVIFKINVRRKHNAMRKIA